MSCLRSPSSLPRLPPPLLLLSPPSRSPRRTASRRRTAATVKEDLVEDLAAVTGEEREVVEAGEASVDVADSRDPRGREASAVREASVVKEASAVRLVEREDGSSRALLVGTDSRDRDREDLTRVTGHVVVEGADGDLLVSWLESLPHPTGSLTRAHFGLAGAYRGQSGPVGDSPATAAPAAAAAAPAPATAPSGEGGKW